MDVMERQRNRGIRRARAPLPNTAQRFNLFKWEQMLMLNDKAVPYNILKIYDGLSYRCACGQIDMSARDFITHTKEHHHGVVQKFSQINRPPWFDWIKYDEEMEEVFCFTNEENLDK